MKGLTEDQIEFLKAVEDGSSKFFWDYLKCGEIDASLLNLMRIVETDSYQETFQAAREHGLWPVKKEPKTARIMRVEDLQVGDETLIGKVLDIDDDPKVLARSRIEYGDGNDDFNFGWVMNHHLQIILDATAGATRPKKETEPEPLFEKTTRVTFTSDGLDYDGPSSAYTAVSLLLNAPASAGKTFEVTVREVVQCP